MGIIAIDPGNVESAYVIADTLTLKPIEFGKIANKELLEKIKQYDDHILIIEMIASYGMAVGKEVFETVFWIGQFWESAHRLSRYRIYRKEVKMNICNSMKAKDCNIRKALIDRFGEVGTKKNQGFFYGFKADIWQAYAVLVTYYDKYLI
jgi:hypothetical protein